MENNKKKSPKNVVIEIPTVLQIQKELEPVPLPFSMLKNNIRIYNKSNKSNKKCKFWPDCTKGDDCIFKHDELYIDTHIDTPTNSFTNSSKGSFTNSSTNSSTNSFTNSSKGSFTNSPLSHTLSPLSDIKTLAFWKNKADAEEQVNKYCIEHIDKLRQDKFDLDILLQESRTRILELDKNINNIEKYYDDMRNENNILRKKILVLEDIKDVEIEYNRSLCSQLLIRPPGI